MIFLAFCVIMATLVGQGLTLPWLVRRLGMVATTGQDAEEAHARLAAVEAALDRLNELADELPERGAISIDFRRAANDLEHRTDAGLGRA